MWLVGDHSDVRMPKIRRSKPLRRPDGAAFRVGDILVARSPIGRKSYQHDFVQVLQVEGTTLQVQAIEKREVSMGSSPSGAYMYTFCQPDASRSPGLGDLRHKYQGQRWLWSDGRADRRHKAQFAFRYCAPDAIVRDTFWEPDVT